MSRVYIPVELRRLVEDFYYRQDACSTGHGQDARFTATGRMPVLRVTGKMPVLRQQAGCLFYGDRQDACSTD